MSDSISVTSCISARQKRTCSSRISRQRCLCAANSCSASDGCLYPQQAATSWPSPSGTISPKRYAASLFTGDLQERYLVAHQRPAFGFLPYLLDPRLPADGLALLNPPGALGQPHQRLRYIKAGIE